MNSGKVPEGAGVFSYRGDDDHGRMSYDGDWKNKAAHGYGVMKWQNGDRSDRPSLSLSSSSRPCYFYIFLYSIPPAGTKATGRKV